MLGLDRVYHSRHQLVSDSAAASVWPDPHSDQLPLVGVRRADLLNAYKAHRLVTLPRNERWRATDTPPPLRLWEGNLTSSRGAEGVRRVGEGGQSYLPHGQPVVRL